MIDSHEEVVMLHTIAQEVENVSNNFATFETFKLELTNTLKSVFENQNILKQELFLIRNSQADTASFLKQTQPSSPSSPPESDTTTKTTGSNTIPHSQQPTESTSWSPLPEVPVSRTIPPQDPDLIYRITDLDY